MSQYVYLIKFLNENKEKEKIERYILENILNNINFRKVLNYFNMYKSGIKINVKNEITEIQVLSNIKLANAELVDFKNLMRDLSFNVDYIQFFEVEKINLACPVDFMPCNIKKGFKYFKEGLYVDDNQILISSQHTMSNVLFNRKSIIAKGCNAWDIVYSDYYFHNRLPVHYMIPLEFEQKINMNNFEYFEKLYQEGKIEKLTDNGSLTIIQRI